MVKSKQEKIEIAKGIEAESLVELLIGYATDFNPCDFDKCDTYEVIKAEVIRRMKGVQE